MTVQEILAIQGEGFHVADILRNCVRSCSVVRSAPALGTPGHAADTQLLFLWCPRLANSISDAKATHERINAK